MAETTEAPSVAVTRWRSRHPGTVDAACWDGTPAGAVAIIEWIRGNGGRARYLGEVPAISVDTVNGAQYAQPGGWVAMFPAGTFRPFAAVGFREQYEPADGTAVAVPAGELAAFGTVMERAQEIIRARETEIAELRRTIRGLNEARERAIRDAALEQFGDVIRDATDAALAPRLAEIEAAARAAERERIRQVAIDCRAVTVSPTGRMQPFEELLRRSPEENTAMLLEAVKGGGPS
jgi:hypothetical protein